jgi:peroxiredoxin Q/BCP
VAKELKAGDPAPPFDLPTAGGGRVSLAGLKGKRAVLYFYPKDDTPGCTQEALNFTERAKAFAAAKTQVIGVSRDSVAKHDKFAAKHGLSVILASSRCAPRSRSRRRSHSGACSSVSLPPPS